jgi:predicted AlkP superfamily phosphohydrolase/phosphomutase
VSADTLVVGLDGATWAVADALDLPNLGRLKRGGLWAALDSTTPPMTLPSWSSFLTGCGPGTHGIYDFTAREPGAYRLHFLNATHRRVPTIHRVLSDRGARVASLCVPTTFPPEPLNGVCVSGFDSPVATTVEAAHCEPASLYGEMARRFGGLKFADFQEGDIGPGWHEAALAALLREAERKEAVCRWLLDRERWDLFTVVFGESDTVAHHFWMFHDRASPRHRPGFEDAIARVYRRLDAALGELAARADRVCVVSDHGFGGAGDVAIYLNRFLESKGWLAWRHGAGRWSDRLKRLATRLPVERVVRRLPPGVLDRVESAGRYGVLDFARTKAWSDEMNYAATIHLNLRGREPQGQDVDVDRLVADLGEWSVEGRPVVERVQRADDVFGRDRAPGAPDLVLTLALRDGYSVTTLPSSRVPAGTTWRRLEPREFAGGKGLGTNGSHRQHGVLVMHGRGAPAGRVEAGMPDPMPTLLTWMGQAVPAHVEGRALFGAATAAGPSPPSAAARDYAAGEAEVLRARLTRLGYLG